MAAQDDDHIERQGWGVVAAVYSAKVNNITLSPARRAVAMASALRPIDDDSRVLDVGSGAGVVVKCVAETSSARITAIDSAQGMLDVIQVPHGTRLEKKLLDANDLSKTFAARTFTHAFCTFVLHIVPDKLHILKEMRAVLQVDGVIAIAVWGQRMDNNAVWRQACRTIDPRYELPAALQNSSHWSTPETLRQNLEIAGFRDIQVSEQMTMPFGFESAESWTQFFFEAKHPHSQVALDSWKGDMAAARKALLKVTREEYDDAKGMKASAVIAVARV